jgi:hypothetical protein
LAASFAVKFQISLARIKGRSRSRIGDDSAGPAFKLILGEEVFENDLIVILVVPQLDKRPF